MEQDKIFSQIKSAAENSEAKDFPAMDKVWSRVEGKLDKKVLKKETKLWKKIAIAASALLLFTVGYQFLKTETKIVSPSNEVVILDTISKILPAEKVIVNSETVYPLPKKEAIKILEKQLSNSVVVTVNESITLDTLQKSSTKKTVYEIDEIALKDALENPETYNIIASSPTPDKVEKAGKMNSTLKKNTARQVVEGKVYAGKAKKSKPQVASPKLDPLVVIDGELSKNELSNLNNDEVDSIIELKEPLYIINKVHYTEQEMFGPNPTSPYAPLSKQDIETLTILQPEKATTIYGEKGKKGVVIITTKNGKPKKRF